MSAVINIKRYLKSHRAFRRLIYSFPFRLILLDFKKNLPLLIFWLLFFGIITNHFATRYGVAYLFLGPEYFDQVSFLSYFIVGYSFGGFVIAYNSASYIKNAFRFPFLATLKNPFLKYCLNNSFLPLLFLAVYSNQVFIFLKGEDIMSTGKILLMILSFLIGLASFLIISFTYFFRANKDDKTLHSVRNHNEPRYKTQRPHETGERNPNLVTESRDWYVETYLNAPLSTKLVRPVKHYKKEILKNILIQDQNTAFIFQIVSIISLLGLSFFSNVDAFQIPASASIFLLFTMFIMLFSTFYRWFRGWSTMVFFAFLAAINILHKVKFINPENRAYGLNYNMPKSEYSYDNFKIIDKQYDNLEKDIESTTQILKKWKSKNFKENPENKKPKMVFINVSGGGLRSSLWTFSTLQYIDSLLNGKLLSQTQLITGSSGGMVGAAYLRELYLQKQQHKIPSYYDGKYITDISKDLLNPITFKIATSEWLFPLQHFKVDDHRYAEDRGSAFEQKLEKNTNNAFDKRLGDYQVPEANSIIPMMIFSPSIVNDGRKLLISPQGISYMTVNPKTKIIYNKLFDAIEYSRFFKEQGAKSTVFTSVLRMSATFPYITPTVSLPCEPRMEIMDAGLRDNYGLEGTLRFIKTFNDWIALNTSGIVIIQIRDRHKNILISENPPQTLTQTLVKPMGSFYGTLFEIQDYNQTQQVQMADLWCKSPVDIVDLELRNELNDRISLSWHLTNKEKKKVLASIKLPENQATIRKLRRLLE